MIDVQIPTDAPTITVKYLPLIGNQGVQYALTPDSEDVTDMIAYFDPLGYEIQEIVGSRFTKLDDPGSPAHGQWYEAGFYVTFKRKVQQ